MRLAGDGAGSLVEAGAARDPERSTVGLALDPPRHVTPSDGAAEAAFDLPNPGISYLELGRAA